MRQYFRAAFASAAVAGALLLPGAACGQNVDIAAPAPRVEATATPDDVLRHSVDPSTDLASGDDDALSAALNYDPSTLAGKSPNKPPNKPLRTANAGPGVSIAWSRKDQPDGSASLSVKQPLAIEWDSKVGADLNLPPAPVTTYMPGKPLPGTAKEERSGAAWANLTVPDLATVEVRLAPSDDQRKVGASVQRSLPIGRSLSVMLQNDLSMTENYPAAIPCSNPGTVPQIWDSERKVKLNIAPTGTTLVAASSSSSLENLTHHTFSAEQKIYGPLQVKSSVTDPGQPTSSKSITAGFKLNW